MAPRNTRPTARSLVRDTSGAVYVEFLVAFMPFFIMVLGMMQEALLYSAHLVVQHAATTAARSAMVVMPDCEYRYGGAAQHDANGGGRGDDPVSALTGFLGGGGGGAFGLGGGSSDLYPSGGARLDAIRFGASVPLLATSPSLDELLGDRDPRRNSVQNAIGGTSSQLARLAFGAVAYNNAAMSVTFPRVPRANGGLQTRLTPRGQLTARVTYLYHCGVPIVSAMACDNAAQLYSGVPIRQIEESTRILSGGRWTVVEAASIARRVEAARSRLAIARPALLDEMRGARSGSAGSAVLLVATGGNFSVLRADATMPNQGLTRTIASPCFNDR
ncbi:MAG: pilus assembly protein [Deltaproteobacteria bacterium]|nr:pilus assembly protein [Deltaproteobacteria bacterium]